MFTLWIEWDCGQGGLAFTTEEKIESWVNSNERVIEAFKSEPDDYTEGYDNPFDYFVDEGLLSIRPLKII